MDDFKVRYQGFTPSEFTQAYFKEVLQRLHEEAPSNSYLKATVSKTRDHYKAVVQINSAAGYFVTAASSSKITDIGHKIVGQLHRQLDHWKTLRRSRETIRDPLYWKSFTEVSDESKVS